MGLSWCLMIGRRPPGRRPNRIGALEPVLKSGPDVDTYAELLPPMVGEHVEQSVLPFDISRRPLRGGSTPWTRFILG